MITAAGERPVGFTATSLNSVAAEPPLISFGVGTESSSWPVVAEAEHIGVHILGEEQQELAATFARSGADRFGPSTGWRSGPEGVPLLDGVVAWLVCRVVARIPAGDHRIVIAQVVLGDPSGAAVRWSTTRADSPLCETENTHAAHGRTALATSQFQALAYG